MTITKKLGVLAACAGLALGMAFSQVAPTLASTTTPELSSHNGLQRFGVAGAFAGAEIGTEVGAAAGEPVGAAVGAVVGAVVCYYAGTSKQPQLRRVPNTVFNH